jgi:hypothetical protein
VTWDWQWSSLDRKGLLPPCEQRLAAAAQGCIVQWVGGVTTGSLFPLEESTDNPPREQLLARLDISTVSFVFVVVEDSSNNPPCEQWLARLDIGAGSSLSLFVGQPRCPLVLKTHPTSSGS